MLAPPLEGWRPLLRGILDPPLVGMGLIPLYTPTPTPSATEDTGFVFLSSN